MTMMNSNGNQQKLFIVCDASASMTEGGKLLLMRGIVCTIEQSVRFGYADVKIKLVKLNTASEIIEWNPDDEYPGELLDCEGNVDITSLSKLLGSKPDGKILVLTDCCWSKEDNDRLRLWKSKLPPNTIRIIKIGDDYTQLRKSDDIFPSDEIFLALDNWLPAANDNKNTDESEEDEW